MWARSIPLAQNLSRRVLVPVGAQCRPKLDQGLGMLERPPPNLPTSSTDSRSSSIPGAPPSTMALLRNAIPIGAGDWKALRELELLLGQLHCL